MVLGGILFVSWRLLELVTLIPTMGMLAYFVHLYNSANMLTPASILTLFITSVLAVAWCLFTMFRIGSVRRNHFFCAFIEVCFIGALIASAYELRGAAHSDCFAFGGGIVTTSGPDSITVTYTDPTVTADKVCAILKASFAFAIMNCIFFAVTTLIILSLRRGTDVKEEYVSSRHHGSRRGHSRSSHRSRRSSSGRRDYFV